MGVQPAHAAAGLVAARPRPTRPARVHDHVAARRRRASSRRSPVTISGTASDSGGGVVAGVEVSIDGGPPGIPRPGTTSWSYTLDGRGLRPVPGSRPAPSTTAGTSRSPAAGVTARVSVPLQPAGSRRRPRRGADHGHAGRRARREVPADVDGYVTGIRFYKGPATAARTSGACGPRRERCSRGDLHRRDGERLAGGHASTARSRSPRARPTSPPTSRPIGGYALNAVYFSIAMSTTRPLRALADGVEGGNGVFRYGSASSFPNQSYKPSNYWVDVGFDPTDGRRHQATDRHRQPRPQTAPRRSTTASTSRPRSARRSTARRSGTATLSLSDGGGAVVPTSVSYDAVARDGDADAQHAACLLVRLYRHARRRPRRREGQRGQPLASDRIVDVHDPGASGVPVHALERRRPAQPSPPSNDPKRGRARRQVPRRRRRLRHRHPLLQGRGQHRHACRQPLVAAGGTLLARATFTGETATGWQQVVFDAPVPITADTTYVASYFAPNGRYAVDRDYFARPRAPPPLRALPTASPAATASTATARQRLPDRDLPGDQLLGRRRLRHDPRRHDTTPPRVAETSPAAGSTGADHRGSRHGDASPKPIERVDDQRGTFELRDRGSDSGSGHGHLRRAARKATLEAVRRRSPTATVLHRHRQRPRRHGHCRQRAHSRLHLVVHDPLPRACPCSALERLGPAGHRRRCSDPSPVEVGVKFRSDLGRLHHRNPLLQGRGRRTAERMSGTSGPRPASLLGRATFVSRNRVGLADGVFETPVAINADTTYVASYFAPLGRYSPRHRLFRGAVQQRPAACAIRDERRVQLRHDDAVPDHVDTARATTGSTSCSSGHRSSPPPRGRRSSPARPPRSRPGRAARSTSPSAATQPSTPSATSSASRTSAPSRRR